MSLSNKTKEQITQWYKGLSVQIDGFVSRSPQRQMIAQVAKNLADDDGRHLVIEGAYWGG